MVCHPGAIHVVPVHGSPVSGTRVFGLHPQNIIILKIKKQKELTDN